MNPKTVLPTLANLLSGLLVSSRRPANVAAFHIGRCGSRVVGDLLKQHPMFVWDGELLSPGRLAGIASRWPWLTRDPFNLLRLRMTMAGQRCYGFETQPTQVERLTIPLDDYVDRLEQFGFNHFLLIERRNHLQRIVSILRGHQSAQWHRIEGPANSGKPSLGAETATSAVGGNQITLDLDHLSLNWGTDVESRSLIAHLEQTEQAVNQLRDVLGRRQLLSLTYEDDIKDQPSEAYRQICEFVGLEPKPVEVRFQKTNPHPLSEVVTNFAEVQRRLQDTRFAWMLDP